MAIIGFISIMTNIALVKADCTNCPAQFSEPPIPQWIKNNAKWWSEGSAENSYFVQGLYYLIDNGMLKVIPPGGSLIHSTQIPMWVKNDASWWADDKMSETDFLNAMQYLLTRGIIRI